MMLRARLNTALILLSWSLPLLIVPAACGGSKKSAGAGEECFRDADCVEGLVCVEGACSSDVTPLVPEVRERPMGDGGAGAMPAVGAGGSGAMPGAGGSTMATATTTTTTASTGMGGSSTTSGAGGSGVSGTGNEAGAEGQ